MPSEPLCEPERRFRGEVREWRVRARSDDSVHVSSWRYSRYCDALARYRRLQEGHIFGLDLLVLEERRVYVVETWKAVTP